MDYSKQNLQGKSFKGQNLTNADFSDADIRGANFTNAILTGANFSRVKAGLQKRQAIFLVFVSCLIAGISGVLFAFICNVFFLIDFGNQVVTIITKIAWVMIIATGSAFKIFAFAFAAALAVAGDLAFAAAFGAAFVAAFAKAFALAGGDSFGIFLGAVAGAGTVVSAYIGWLAIKGDKKHDKIRNFAVAFATFGGTSFRNADLTDANFTLANLKNTDFRNAILTRTCLRKIKKLDLVRPGNTDLKHN